MKALRRIHIGLLIGALLMMAFEGRAQVAVTPTSLQFTADQRFQLVTVHNDSNIDKTFHVSLDKWIQVKEEDRYEESRDMIISPPIFVVSAGKSQTVRLARIDTSQDDFEKSYKLTVAEVPALFTKTLASNAAGVSMVINFKLPVFIAPPQGGRAEFKWFLTKSSDGKMLLALQNLGNMHIRVDSLRIEADGKKGFEIDRFYNALTKQNLTFKTGIRATNKNYKLLATLNGEKREFDVKLNEATEK